MGVRPSGLLVSFVDGMLLLWAALAERTSDASPREGCPQTQGLRTIARANAKGTSS
jgi:hypothetical protein